MHFLNSFGLRLYFNAGANLENDFKILVQSSYWNINLEILVQILHVFLWGFAVAFSEICLHAQTCSSHTEKISSILEGWYTQTQGSWWVQPNERGVTASRPLVFKHSRF